MQSLNGLTNRLSRRRQTSIQRQTYPHPRLDRNDRARLILYVECIARETRPQGEDRGYCRNRFRANGNPWAISRQGHLKKVDVAVIKALLNQFHNPQTGECYPAIETIAKAAACSPASVIRSLPRLETTGLLIRYARTQIIMDHQGHRRPRRTSNSYAFPLPSAWFWPGNTPLKSFNTQTDLRSPYEPRKDKSELNWPNGKPSKSRARTDMEAYLARLKGAADEKRAAAEAQTLAAIDKMRRDGQI